MPYIGNQSGTTGFSKIPAKQDLTGATGSTLTLSNAVSSPESIDLFINNVRQEPTESYTTDGTTVNLVGYTVAATDDIYVVYNSLAQQTSTHPSNQALQATSGTFSSTLAVTGATTTTGGLNVGTIKEATGTTTAMTIDSSGRILLSAIPFMKMNIGTNPSSSATTTGTITPFANVLSSRAITLNTSTYKFQVPVTGLYSFNGAVRVNSSTIEYVWWSVADSSGTILQTNQLVLGNHYVPNGSFSSCAGSLVQSLTASTDYQIVYGVSSAAAGTVTLDGSQTWMDIFLVGAS